MAQALLNNLNTIMDERFDLKDKVQADSGIGFEKIFDLTNAKALKDSGADIEQKTTVTMSTQESKNNKSFKQNDNCQNSIKEVNFSENNNDSVELTDVKNPADSTETMIINKISQENENKDNDQTLQNIIIETAIEIVAENCLTEEIADEAAENTLSETEESITENITNESEEEVPTMYNELNTLENPAAAILLQTQITKTKHVIQENEQVETSPESENILTKNESLNISYKQFENDNALKTVTGFSDNRAEKTEPSKTKVILNEKVVKDLNVQSVEEEGVSQNNSENSFMQEFSSKEQVVKVMINGDLKSTSEFNVESKLNVTKSENINPSKILEQISKQLDKMSSGSKLTMILNPESLGKINIQLLNTKNGLTAMFTVTSNEVKEMLMKGLEGLKENLLAQGISVESVNIRYDETGDGENTSDWTEQEGSRGGYKHQKNRQTKDEQNQQFEQLMFEYNNGNV